MVETLAKLDKAFAELRFDDMADAIYHFTWGTFCDWYVELVKGAFDDETKRRRRLGVRPDPGHAPPVHAVRHRGAVGRDGRAAVRADRRQVAGAGGASAIRSAKRARSTGWSTLIGEVRAMRAELNIPWSADARCRIVIGGDRSDAASGSTRNAPTLARMAKLGSPVELADAVPDGRGADRRRRRRPIAFPLEGAIDLDAERARLSKAVAAAEKERDSLAARLANPAFTERAKPEAVEKARADHDARAAEAERLAAALARLG